MSCPYLEGYKAGEVFEGEVSTWTEYNCNKDQDTCPFLDDHQTECPIKENLLDEIELYAVRKLAGDRKDSYRAVFEQMEAEI